MSKFLSKVFLLFFVVQIFLTSYINAAYAYTEIKPIANLIAPETLNITQENTATPEESTTDSSIELSPKIPLEPINLNGDGNTENPNPLDNQELLEPKDPDIPEEIPLLPEQPEMGEPLTAGFTPTGPIEVTERAKFANSYDQSVSNLASSATDVGIDAAATAIPFVPAVISKTDNVVDTIKMTEKGESKIDDIVDEAHKYLGNDVTIKTNKDGDKIFMSKDGNNKIRFDLNNTKPHENPHFHIEEFINNKWIKSGPKYTKDVPKK